MTDDRFAQKAPPQWTEGGARDQTSEPGWRHEETPLHRFLGGSPGGVFLRLLFVSLIVGALLMWLDIRPRDIFNGLAQFIEGIWARGFDALREIADYIIAGAVIVLPVWLVLRLMNMRSAR